MKPNEIQSSLRRRIIQTLFALLVFIAMSLPVRAGALLELFYQTGYPAAGAGLTNLTQDPSFPFNPDIYFGSTNGLQEFTNNFSTGFGSWLRGYLEAPQTGQYTFWIASDDDGQFWLSTDSSTNNKALICQNVGAVGYEQYNTKPAQQSAPISLVAGLKYYYEVFHSQGTGPEHAEVSWMLPDGSTETVISQEHLWALPVDPDPTAGPVPTAPALLTSYGSVGVPAMDLTTTVLQGRPVNFTPTIEASMPATVVWYSNNVVIPGAILGYYNIASAGLSQDGTTYTIVVSNSLGVVSNSTTLSITPDTTPPNLLDAVNLGNNTADIAVVYDKPMDSTTSVNPTNYSINNGASITSARAGSATGVVLLQTTGVVQGTSYTLVVNNVQDVAGNTIAANTSVVLDQNLSTWFKFDDATGTNVTDSSGNGLNASLVNSALPDRVGKVVRGVNFDGQGGYVKMQNGYANFTTGITIAVWAYPTASLNSWARFCDLGNGAPSDNILFARNATSADLTYETKLGTVSAGPITASGAIVLNQWQHFVATEDSSGNVVLYKNGVVVATGVETGLPNNVTRAQCYIGRSDFPQDGYYQGKMDDFRIYNRVLGPQAVMALAAGGGPDDTNGQSAITVVATTPTTAEKILPPGVFTVTRNGPTNSALTVNYTLGGTAINGTNYTTLSGAVVIPAGTNAAQVVVAPINLSFLVDLSRTVILTIAPSATYLVGDTSFDTVTIFDNDVAPAATLAYAENALLTSPSNRLDVWFAAPITLPTATNTGNYVLSASGINILSAWLRTNANYDIGVVLVLDSPVPAGTTLTVSGVQDAGGNSVTTNIPVNIRAIPFNIVANVYHGGGATRLAAFNNANDGVVNNIANAGTGFDTFLGLSGGVPVTAFAGMQYGAPVTFNAIKVDLGQQFSDGGIWVTNPNVYILTRPTDSASTKPETDTNLWMKVPATVISGSLFGVISGNLPNPSPQTPIVFNLSSLPASQRTGYGWAVGGVNCAGGNAFLSISELRAYGTAAPAFSTQPTNESFSQSSFWWSSPGLGGSSLAASNLTIVAGQSATFFAHVNAFAGFYQWYNNGSPISGATNGNYTTVQESTGSPDNGAQIYCVVSNPTYGSITSQVVNITVSARTTPPAVVEATVDRFNNVDVWYDEPVEATTATTIGNYSLNDGGLTITNAVQNSHGTHIFLSFSGTQTVSNLTLTVTGVLDTFGNTLTSQTVNVLAESWPVRNIVANAYQQGRAAELTTVTGGTPNYTGAVDTTFSGNTYPFYGYSDFEGLIYSQAQVFGLVKVDLGHQFSDGGDWSAPPTLYILKTPVDPNSSYPETNANWVAVPARLVSANVFSWEIDSVSPSANSPVAFDLSSLPTSQRIGYGWAVGGVPANALASAFNGLAPANEFISVTQLRGFGIPASALGGSGPPQINLDVYPSAQTVIAGEPVAYSVYASGNQPITYQWKLNGTNVVDNGRITGSQSNILTIAEAFSSDQGTYQLFLNNNAGSAFSATTVLTVLPRNVLGNGAGWTANGNAKITNGLLTLTDGGGGEVASAWLNGPQYIGAFTASWTYQDVGAFGKSTADGYAFVLQNSSAGATAIGGGGGALAYSGILPSAAIEFDIYPPNNPGVAFRTNGVTGVPYNSTPPVTPTNGNPISIVLNYDGTTLSMRMMDLVTSATFTTNWVTNLMTLVGGTNTAYVGLTAADGGTVSQQVITNFLFSSLVNITIQPANGNAFAFSWPAYVGGLVLQESPALSPANWINLTNGVGLANGSNQVVIPAVGSNQFYRLKLP